MALLAIHVTRLGSAKTRNQKGKSPSPGRGCETVWERGPGVRAPASRLGSIERGRGYFFGGESGGQIVPSIS